MFGLKQVLSGGTTVAYRHEIGGAGSGYRKGSSGMASGLVAGTVVATAMGWRPVEAIVEGDMVLTFDRGLQPVRRVYRGALWTSPEPCPRALWPLKVPEGAVGNQQELVLVPEQSVLVESDTADLLFDDPFALVSASDLEGFRGIERMVPFGAVDVVQLQFDEDEVIFAASGALIFCPMLDLVSITEVMSVTPKAGRYMSLAGEEAIDFVDCLREEDAIAAGQSAAAPPPEYAHVA